MISRIYLTNCQLNEEHKDNLSRKDKRISMFIDGSFDIESKTDRKKIERNLSYPSLESCVLKFWIEQDTLMADILKRMVFVIYHMRKQDIHRHSNFFFYVNAEEFRVIHRYNWIPGNTLSLREYSYNGRFHLKVDVSKLKVLENRSNLIAPPFAFVTKGQFALEIDKRAQLALNVLRETMKGEEEDRVAGLVIYTTPASSHLLNNRSCFDEESSMRYTACMTEMREKTYSEDAFDDDGILGLGSL